MNPRGLPFCPPGEGAPPARVEAFVAYWRGQPWHSDPHPDFDSQEWEVTGHLARRRGRQASPGGHTLAFVSLDPLPSAMSRSVGNVARAWIKGSPRLSDGSLRTRVNAFRSIDAALASAPGTICLDHGMPLDAPEVQGEPHLVNCSVAVLDRAVAIARASCGTSARSVCLWIGRIAAFLDSNGMASMPIGGWCPPEIPRRDVGDRFGSVFAKERATKLPNDEFLQVLTDAYGLATETCDVVVVSVAALLLSASGRVNEVLAIEPDPWVEAATADGARAFGLRWRGSKGFPDHVKWLLAGTEDLVRDALQRLHEATAEGRRIKAWYDENPDRLYLPPHLEELRGKDRLLLKEVGQLLGKAPTRNLDVYVAKHGLVRSGNRGRPAGDLSFASVESHVLARLPTRQRDAGGRDSHPLLIVEEQTFEARKPGGRPCPCMYAVVTTHQINDGLGANPERTSTFKNLGLDPGSQVGATTHSFRHLNETELAAGLSEDDRAVWAGRSDRGQNRVYDHEPNSALRKLVRGAKRHGGDPGDTDGKGGPAASTVRKTTSRSPGEDPRPRKSPGPRRQGGK